MRPVERALFSKEPNRSVNRQSRKKNPDDHYLWDYGTLDVQSRRVLADPGHGYQALRP